MCPALHAELRISLRIKPSGTKPSHQPSCTKPPAQSSRSQPQPHPHCNPHPSDPYISPPHPRVELACRYDHNSVVRLCGSPFVPISALAALVDAVDGRGRTPLHHASDAVDQLSGLVYKFAPPPDGLSPYLLSRTPDGLTMAADHPHVHVVSQLAAVQATTVRALLAFGANASAAAAHSGSTPLHLAARSGALAVVRALLGAHARVDATNAHGQTPLHVAAAAGHADVCAALLAAGADADASDAWGRSARWYVEVAGGAMTASDAASIFSGARKRRAVDSGGEGGGEGGGKGGGETGERIEGQGGGEGGGGDMSVSSDHVSGGDVSGGDVSGGWGRADRPVPVRLSTSRPLDTPSRCRCSALSS
jgi:hypothetical protein